MKDNPDLSPSTYDWWTYILVKQILGIGKTFAVEQAVKHYLDEDIQFVCAIPMGIPTVKGVLLFVLQQLNLCNNESQVREFYPKHDLWYQSKISLVQQTVII